MYCFYMNPTLFNVSYSIKLVEVKGRGGNKCVAFI
jgi:hypothetical protein